MRHGEAAASCLVAFAIRTRRREHHIPTVLSSIVHVHSSEAFVRASTGGSEAIPVRIVVVVVVVSSRVLGHMKNIVRGGGRMNLLTDRCGMPQSCQMESTLRLTIDLVSVVARRVLGGGGCHAVVSSDVAIAQSSDEMGRSFLFSHGLDSNLRLRQIL